MTQKDEDFDSPEWNQPWDGKEPFMLGRCSTCGKVKGICCGQGDREYCVECCEHPWEDESGPTPEQTT